MKKLLLLTLLCFLPLLGAKAQNIQVENLKGEKVLFSEIIKGDMPVVVSFWATWCKPCMMEMEAFKEIQDEWDGKVRIVSISIDDSRSKSKVPSLVKGRSLPFEIFLDPNKSLYNSLNTLGVPYTFIFHKGKQVYSHSGYTPGDEEVVIEKALKYTK